MARNGRPPVSAALKERVLALAALGLGRRRIEARLADEGIQAAHETIARILRAARAADDTLGPGERRVDPPVRCQCGQLCTILPCRKCAQMPNRRILDHLAAAEAKHAALGIPFNPPRRPRKRRKFELASELEPAAAKRLEALRQQKRERGEL